MEATIRQRFIKFVSPRQAKIFAFLALIILFSTTVLWSLLAAKVHSGNADQLINVYLLDNSTTFDEAVFPGAHTFLLKWPIFFLVKFFGSSFASFIVITILVSLLTVGVLAFLLYKIERRPLVFGVLCLALASVLLLVPAQPYPGILLPANMAMLTTRNLEYGVFLLALILLIKAPRIKHFYFWLSVIVMALLIATDKLFFALSFGGGLLSLLVYGLTKRTKMIHLSLRWLLLSLIGLGLATLILYPAGAPGLPYIIDHSSLSPFGIIHSLKKFELGVVYASLSILTNFGANPAFDTTILRNMPHDAIGRLTGWGGLAYLINLSILLGGVFFSFKLWIKSLRNQDEVKLSTTLGLPLLLIWTGLAAVIIYVISNHYFAADARYLTVILFAIFIATASYLSRKQLRPEALALAGLLICLSLLSGLVATIRNYHIEQAALADFNKRNSLVAQALVGHPVTTLVGDYWRVVPTRLKADNKINILPQIHCLQNSDVLSSRAWDLNLYEHSFAYLLTRDKSLTDYNNCSLDQVVAAYGRPNSSVLIAGSSDHPLEQLLFYDQGINRPVNRSNKPLPPRPAAVVPLTIDQLPKFTNTACPKATIMNTVAHQDDDILFMNPDTLHDIHDGNCIRSVYITAGDAGQGQLYWLSRERGSEAAYDHMLGSSNLWVNRIVKLSDQEFINIASPRNNSQISLIFMHLPDGNTTGSGFKVNNYESLVKLDYGRISSIHSVDDQSVYTSDQLVAALVALMSTYLPSEVRTQSNFVNRAYPDHSDHLAAGRFTKRAYMKYLSQTGQSEAAVPIKYYLGYTERIFPPNIVGDDLQESENAFLTYANFDPAVCHNHVECFQAPTYSSYLQRQYQYPY